MPSIVIFGATGFLGVPLSKAIKEAHPSWSVTAFVRSGRSESTVKSELGVDRVAFGDIFDYEAVKKVSQEHEIAINAATSFDGRIVSAIVDGLKMRPNDAKGKIIHISGAGNFIDMGTSGEFDESSKVWNDNNEDDIKQINEKMFNGPTDTVVLKAGAENVVDSYIVCPSVVYGGASIDAKGLGIGYQLVIGNAKPLGYVPYVGNGSAVVSTVHVLDVIPFLLKIVERAAAGPADGSAYNRFYMLETQRVTWKELATELAHIMHQKGIFPSVEPKSVSIDQAGEGEVKYLVGSNMLIQGDNAAKMGYQAAHPGILEQIHEDLKEAVV